MLGELGAPLGFPKTPCSLFTTTCRLPTLKPMRNIRPLQIIVVAVILLAAIAISIPPLLNLDEPSDNSTLPSASTEAVVDPDVASDSLAASTPAVQVELVGELRADSGAQSVAISGDESLVAVGLENGALLLWSLETLNNVQSISGAHVGATTSVAFDPDNPQRLATGGADTTVRLWQTNTQTPQLQLLGHQGAVRGIAFGSGGVIASASADATVILWDAASGTPRQTLVGHPSEVLSVAFAPGAAQLASGDANGDIRLWESASGQLAQRLTGHADRVTDVAYLADGTRLLSSSFDARALLWTLAQPTTPLSLQTTAGTSWPGVTVDAVALHPSGTLLFAATRDGTARAALFDPATGTVATLPPLTPHTGAITSLSIAPPGNFLAVASTDGLIRLWRVRRNG